MFDLAALRETSRSLRAVVPPTPQYAWPLLAERLGCEVWVKHENHAPTGAFKVRGGLVFVEQWLRRRGELRGLVSATRGNHGLSLALACRRFGVPVTLVVPEGNAVEKNAAMQAFGARLVIAGCDFDEARVQAHRLALHEGLENVPPFHPDLVRGVATYALEWLEAVPQLNTVYVPIGMGSGICAMIQVRDLLGLEVEIVGVVSSHADAMACSIEQGRVVTTDSAHTFADGLACRQPLEAVVRRVSEGVSRIVRVSDRDVAAAIRVYHQDTHNTAEGAGAAGLAALMQERARHRGKTVGVVLSGANIDLARYAGILLGSDG